jgi:hypothetical protein
LLVFLPLCSCRPPLTDSSDPLQFPFSCLYSCQFQVQTVGSFPASNFKFKEAAPCLFLKPSLQLKHHHKQSSVHHHHNLLCHHSILHRALKALKSTTMEPSHKYLHQFQLTSPSSILQFPYQFKPNPCLTLGTHQANLLNPSTHPWQTVNSLSHHDQSCSSTLNPSSQSLAAPFTATTDVSIRRKAKLCRALCPPEPPPSSLSQQLRLQRPTQLSLSLNPAPPWSLAALTATSPLSIGNLQETPSPINLQSLKTCAGPLCRAATSRDPSHRPSYSAPSP